MMPNVRLSDTTTSLLKQLAVPLEDSYDSVIRRLAETALQGVPYALPGATSTPTSASTASREVPENADLPETMPSVEPHPELTHSHVRDAVFNGVRIAKPAWNSLAKHAHEAAAKQLGSFDKVRLATKANIREGQYEEEGFTYLKPANLSLQNMDSNMSWENTLRLAKKLQVPLRVVVEWSNTSKAGDNAGKTHVLSWTPTKAS